MKNDQSVIEDKIKYSNSFFYELHVPENVKLNVKVGDHVDSRDSLFDLRNSEEAKKVPYKGKLKKKLGDKVKVGEVIAVKGGFRKKLTKSNVGGEIVSVSDEELYILPKVKVLADADLKAKEVRMRFSAKVKKILKDRIIFEFSGVRITLISSRGDSVVGRLRYISGEKFRKPEKLSGNLDGSIIVTDHLTSDVYPIMSTLGAVGVIANSIDYATYEQIIILAVPIGIISGFGSLKEDKAIVKYLSSKDEDVVWFDSLYSRLVIPEQKKPHFVDGYKFDLNKVGVI